MTNSTPRPGEKVVVELTREEIQGTLEWIQSVIAAAQKNADPGWSVFRAKLQAALEDGGEAAKGVSDYQRLEEIANRISQSSDSGDQRNASFLRKLAKRLEGGEEQVGAGDALAIRAAARELANVAATAVCEPRRFHENYGERQQALSQAVAAVRNALSTQQAVPSSPGSSHAWILVSDEDEDQTEFCKNCGAQRNRHGALSERASITGGWPSAIDCDLLAAVGDPDAAFSNLPQAEQDAYNASRDSILRARGYAVPAPTSESKGASK